MEPQILHFCWWVVPWILDSIYMHLVLLILITNMCRNLQLTSWFHSRVLAASSWMLRLELSTAMVLLICLCLWQCAEEVWLCKCTVMIWPPVLRLFFEKESPLSAGIIYPSRVRKLEVALGDDRGRRDEFGLDVVKIILSWEPPPGKNT